MKEDEKQTKHEDKDKARSREMKPMKEEEVVDIVKKKKRWGPREARRHQQ